MQDPQTEARVREACSRATRKDWSSAYERLHDALDADAWLVGRVTMRCWRPASSTS